MLDRPTEHTTAPVRKLSRREEHIIGQYLETVMVRHSEDCASYSGFNNDHSVCEELHIPGVTATHIANMRRGVFGNFPRKIAEATQSTLHDRVALLEHQLAYLANRMEESLPATLDE